MAKPKPSKHGDDKKTSQAASRRNGKNATKNASKGGKSADNDTTNALKGLGKLFGL